MIVALYIGLWLLGMYATVFLTALMGDAPTETEELFACLVGWPIALLLFLVKWAAELGTYLRGKR